ncbi:MAG: hypothetical protein ACI8O8_003180 [Oleiphilaceae bacterium]|jgi:hypothetical protein
MTAIYLGEIDRYSTTSLEFLDYLQERIRGHF